MTRKFISMFYDITFTEIKDLLISAINLILYGIINAGVSLIMFYLVVLKKTIDIMLYNIMKKPKLRSLKIYESIYVVVWRKLAELSLLSGRIIGKDMNEIDAAMALLNRMILKDIENNIADHNEKMGYDDIEYSSCDSHSENESEIKNHKK